MLINKSQTRFLVHLANIQLVRIPQSMSDHHVLKPGARKGIQDHLVLPNWPELIAISMMESLICVAGSPCESTSSGGPGREMSSSAETLGGDSRVLERSDEDKGVHRPFWRGVLGSSDKERTDEPCQETGIVQIQVVTQKPN